MKCFLQVGGAGLDEAVLYSSISNAVFAYGRIARDLARFGQKVEATVHIAETRKEIQGYPDFVLKLGPHGGILKERA